MPQRARAFCGTINVADFNDATELELQRAATNSTFAIWGRETAPTTGQKHYQWYIRFDNAKTWDQMKALLPTAHIETARGSPHHNYVYCSKSGNFETVGTIPEKQGSAGGAATKAKWEEAKQAAIEGRIDDISSEMYIRYYKTLNQIKTDHMKPPPNLQHSLQVGYWYVGSTGTGKSRTARERYPDAYLKVANNKW